MTIEKIKSDINHNMGNEVRVIHNEGRNKIYECNGKIVEVYNNIFICLVRFYIWMEIRNIWIGV